MLRYGDGSAEYSHRAEKRKIGWMLSATLVLTLLVVACGGTASDVPDQLAPETTRAVDDPPHSAALTPAPSPTATYPADTLQGITVALDAGHGAGDEGASGFCVDVEVIESDVNLQTREYLRELLESVGATVYLVPQPPGREERVLAAEAVGADFLLSIHHNGYDDTGQNYTTTFVSDDADLLLASFIQPQLLSALALDDSGIQFEDFGITHYGRIPAVLTEASFITNSVEACNFLGNQTRIRAEALALFHGVVAYARAVGLASGQE